MDSDLPKLPSLEEVLKSLDEKNLSEDKKPNYKKQIVDGSGNRKSIPGEYPLSMNCPLLKQKAGGDGKIEVEETRVNCKYFVAAAEGDVVLRYCLANKISIFKLMFDNRSLLREPNHYFGCHFWLNYCNHDSDLPVKIDKIL